MLLIWWFAVAAAYSQVPSREMHEQLRKNGDSLTTSDNRKFVNKDHLPQSMLHFNLFQKNGCVVQSNPFVIASHLSLSAQYGARRADFSGIMSPSPQQPENF